MPPRSSLSIGADQLAVGARLRRGGRLAVTVDAQADVEVVGQLRQRPAAASRARRPTGSSCRASVFIDPDASRMISRFFRVLAGGASALMTASSPVLGGPSCRQSEPILPVASVPFTSTANGAVGRRQAASASGSDVGFPGERDAGGSKRAWRPGDAWRGRRVPASPCPCSPGSTAASADTCTSGPARSARSSSRESVVMTKSPSARQHGQVVRVEATARARATSTVS